MHAKSKKDFLLFLLHSLPYFLPISCSIALLIASYATARQLSNSNELTALRTFGFSMGDLYWPIGGFAIFLSALLLVITHEITPLSRMACQTHLYEAAQQNPLSFFREDFKIGSNTLLLDTLGMSKGNEAENVIIATMGHDQDHMQLMYAKNLLFQNHKILLNDAMLMTSKEEPEEGFLFFVERAEKATMPVNLSAHFSIPEVDPNHYDFQKSSFLMKKSSIAKIHSKTVNELSKRSFFPLLSLPLSLLGFFSGTRVSRNRSVRSVTSMALLVILCLSCFLTAKSFQKSALFSFLFYICIPLSSLSCYLVLKKRKLDRGYA